MEEFLKYWSYLGVDYFALKPAPIEKNLGDKERAKHIERLAKFYSGFGFKLLKSPTDEEPCMGKNLNFNN
jgi:hypothetical protein